jgi:hypothetical protein
MEEVEAVVCSRSAVPRALGQALSLAAPLELSRYLRCCPPKLFPLYYSGVPTIPHSPKCCHENPVLERDGLEVSGDEIQEMHHSV